MSGLSGLELARLRRTATDFLPTYGEVWRRTLSSDSKGGKTETLARVSSGPWRVSPTSSSISPVSVYAKRLGGVDGWWATAQYHVDVRLGDQLRVNGQVLEVVGFDAGMTWHISARVLCRAVA